MKTSVAIPLETIAEFCQRNHICKLSLFGSVLREDFRPDSDIDMLVEFEPGQRISLLDMAAMEIELTEIMGRKVDLRTAAELSRYFRQDVINIAEKLYG